MKVEQVLAHYSLQTKFSLHLILQIQFYWNTAIFICYILSFCSTVEKVEYLQQRLSGPQVQNNLLSIPLFKVCQLLSYVGERVAKERRDKREMRSACLFPLLSSWSRMSLHLRLCPSRQPSLSDPLLSGYGALPHLSGLRGGNSYKPQSVNCTNETV